MNRLDECGEEGIERAQQWKSLIGLLDAHGCGPMIKVDLSIVRGLAYYTGFVYEAFEATGQGRALAGGGRYDHLIRKLSGNCDLPAAGFAIGDMTLSDCLESNNLLPRYITAPDLFLIFGETERDLGVRLSSRLRKAGHSTTYSLNHLAFQQFKDAENQEPAMPLFLGKKKLRMPSQGKGFGQWFGRDV